MSQKITNALAVTAVLLLLAGCGQSTDKADSGPQGAAKRVTVAIVAESPETNTSQYMGSVIARNRADVQAKAQARVERILVPIGQPVRKGDLLAELDSREFVSRVDQARAVAEQAAQDLLRYEALLGRDAVTRQEYDGVLARKTVAEASLKEAETMLSYARITAPFTGVLTGRSVDVGDLAVPGRPLFVVEEESGRQFVAAIPESRRRSISVGDSVKVEIPVEGITAEGVVEELSPSSDPVSRTFVTKIGLSPHAKLRVGQFGRLHLRGGGLPSLFVPSQAIVRRGQLEFVYGVTEDGRARLRFVRTGRTVQGQTEILAGLSAGERVVVDGLAGLADGDRIEGQL